MLLLFLSKEVWFAKYEATTAVHILAIVNTSHEEEIQNTSNQETKVLQFTLLPKRLKDGQRNKVSLLMQF